MPLHGAGHLETTRGLRQEHQVILKVLGCFEIALDRARQSERVAQEAFAPFVEFFQGFADRCHHCKEEDRLFPCLERCGMPRDGGPIAVMIHEHQLGRAHVRAIAECLAAADAGDAAAIRALLDQGERFLELLRHHIMKEDHVLFEMADQMVQGAERIALTQAYASAEGQAGYTSTFEACRRIAQDLMVKYGVPA
jgi:hemerythrin-like domain-containing protein